MARKPIVSKKKTTPVKKKPAKKKPAPSARTAQKKKAFLQVLKSAMGIITTACEKTEIPRRTIYYWKDEDEEFRKGIEEIQEIALDFAESQLHQAIKARSIPAILFYLKCKGKNRGYVERVEHTGKDGEPIENNVRTEFYYPERDPDEPE